MEKKLSKLTGASLAKDSIATLMSTRVGNWYAKKGQSLVKTRLPVKGAVVDNASNDNEDSRS